MQRLTLGAMLPRASLLQELLQKHIVIVQYDMVDRQHIAPAPSPQLVSQLLPATCDMTADNEVSFQALRGALEKADIAPAALEY